MNFGSKAALAFAGLLVALTGVGGASLFDRLASGNPAVPGSESERGAEILNSLTAVHVEEIQRLAPLLDPLESSISS